GLSASWAVWMMLFGQYFPERAANSRWDRIIRWGLGIPIGAFCVLVAVLSAAATADVRNFSQLYSALTRAQLVPTLLSMAAISTFFINISEKIRHEATPDAKRRLKLLYSGTSVALTP